MIRWTGLAPWGFEFPFSDCLTTTFLEDTHQTHALALSLGHRLRELPLGSLTTTFLAGGPLHRVLPSRWTYALLTRIGGPIHRVLLLRPRPVEREFFIDNLLVRIHFIVLMIRWTGLAPWEFEFPFPGSLTTTFLAGGPLHRVLLLRPRPALNLLTTYWSESTLSS